jgi:hypothetical protein
LNDWEALWVFETRKTILDNKNHDGLANLWKAASEIQKNNLIATVDSIVLIIP